MSTPASIAVPGLPDRYRVDGPLGRGGQAQTLAATDTETDAAVVVKVFRLAGSDAWKLFELFERELGPRAGQAGHEAVAPRVGRGYCDAGSR